MIFDLLTPPQGTKAKKSAVTHPIDVSNWHTEFGWILSNGYLGGYNITDSRTDGGNHYIPQCVKKCGDTGFALGFIFLSPPFSPIRFFCAIFSNLEPDFGKFSPKKSGVWGHFSQKMSSVFNPLFLVDYCTHIDKITKE